jgi:pimeloyl-ACP methyl ester carboxylesterase
MARQALHRSSTSTALRRAHRVDPNTGFRVKDADVEHALATGERVPELEAYFGEQLYAELSKLATTTQSRGVRRGPRVLILPGIMGSKLGTVGAILDDVIWIDPIDVALGNLGMLALNGKASDIRPLGVILFSYLKLKLSLQIAGFDADFHPFDWRRNIGDLGDELARKIGSEGSDVWLVAHSMGGLVARAAIKSGAEVKRLIMLGTPNFGSFAVPQALRGTYPLVRKIAALDTRHSPEELAGIFGTFTGLYQMMPAREKWSGLDLLSIGEWPKSGPRPRADLLRIAGGVSQQLAAPSEKFVLIAGVNRDTVVDMKREGDEFVYTTSRSGDGTVPLDFARLPDIATYYVEEEHGGLPNNSTVERAVVDLLRGETTRELPTSWTPPRAATRRVEEATLRVDPYGGRRGGQISLSERREIASEFASPKTTRSSDAPLAPGSGTIRESGLDHVVVGRQKQRRIDLTLSLGSITDVDARAYVLGIFRDVNPTGPASEIDKRLGGAVTELTSRRMLSGNVGQAFVMPVGRSTLRCDMVLFAGLGTFDSFTPDVQLFAAENVVRVFARTHVEEFATLMFGAGSGRSIAESLANMLAGFLRGLSEADGHGRFRRIILCERDPARYDELKRALYQLAGTTLFQDFEVTITEEPVLSSVVVEDRTLAERGVALAGKDPVYLMVRQTPRFEDGKAAVAELASGVVNTDKVVLEASLLGADGRAAVFSESLPLVMSELDERLGRIDVTRFPSLPQYGEELASMVVPPGIRKLLSTMKDRHLVVVHDAPSSRIPWETVHLRDDENSLFSPALQNGMSRRYLAGNLSIAKWLDKRREDTTLDVLLVYNPTQDLPGADEEGKRLYQAIGSHPSVRIRSLAGREATRARLLDEFRSGEYDVIHYAGHAFFNPDAPEKSGIVCAGVEYLTGADLATLGSLPSLIVFNACEAGRLRGEPRPEKPPVKKLIARTTSFAEAFLRGGAANYIGTYWPVDDRAASLFATTFYGALLVGATVSAALLDARKALEKDAFKDWADYIHYGSPDFVVKLRNASDRSNGSGAQAVTAGRADGTPAAVTSPRTKRSKGRGRNGVPSRASTKRRRN